MASSPPRWRSAGPYAVTQAESGFEALKILPRARYDLDHHRHQHARHQRARAGALHPRLRAHKTTPLIIISTDGREADRDRGMELGANAYLIKPFEPEELLEIVTRAC